MQVKTDMLTGLDSVLPELTMLTDVLVVVATVIPVDASPVLVAVLEYTAILLPAASI